MASDKELIIELGRKVKDKLISWQEAVNEFNKKTGNSISSDAIRKRYYSYNDSYSPKPSKEFESYNEDGTIEITKQMYFDKGVKKTPELILKSFGYDPDEWEIISWSYGKYEVAIKDEEENRECITVRAKIKPIKQIISKKDLISITNEVLKENIKPIKISSSKRIQGLDNNKALILSIADIHLGRYCSELDSGYKYNLDIASKYFKYIIEQLIKLQEQKKVGMLYYTIGNDFYNYDNAHGTTTKGTQLMNSASYRELYKKGLELQMMALKSMREYFNQIKVLLVQGNHDEVLDYTLYLALQQIFADDDVITFKEDYKKTQVEQFGSNAIFIDHGDCNFKRFIQSLPALYSKVYGESKHRYALLHHLHSEHTTEELNGITAYRLSTLAPMDEYEYKNKFSTVLGNQAVFELDKRDGLSSISYIRKR